MFICLIGRTNVGKTTLFNILVNNNIKSSISYIYNTRDRIYGNFFKEKNIKIIDTGAILDFNNYKLKNKVFNQTNIAINSSDLIFFIIIGNTFNKIDFKFYEYLITIKKKIILIINKIDIIDNYYNYSNLKLEKIFYISAKNYIGIKDLNKYILYEYNNNYFINKDICKIDIKISILGNENVGKSTLFNRILKTERSIISNFSGTTIDNIETVLHKNSKNFLLIDTKGINKKINIIHNNILYKNIKNSNIIIFIFDVTYAFTKFDINLINLFIKFNKSILLIFNKIDLLNIKEKMFYKENIEKKLSFIIKNIKIFYISALYSNNIDYIINFIYKLYINLNRKFKTKMINDILKLSFKDYFLNYKKNSKNIKFKYGYIINNNFIKIFIYVNNVYNINNNFKKYLNNFLIKKLNIKSIPLKIIFKKN